MIGGIFMVENTNTQVANNRVKVYGLNIASLVLGIVSIVLWCMWYISIPCSILALIFGIIGIKKHGKGLAIAGLVTGVISLVIWVLLFAFAFMFGFVEGLSEELTQETGYHSSYYYDI